MKLGYIIILLFFPILTFAGTPTDSNLKEPTDETLDIRPYQKHSLIDIDSDNFMIAKSDPKSDYVLVSGKLNAASSSLLYENQCILSKDSLKKSFSILVAVPKNKHQTVIHLTIIDVNGRFVNERFWVRYKNDEKISQPDTSSTNWNLSLNTTSVKYVEGNNSYNSITLTPKAGVQHEFSNNITFHADASMTVLPITQSNSETMSLLEVNALAGYIFPTNNSWSFGAFGGVYFLTSFVSDNSFGFNNLEGPEILFSLTKHYRNSSLSFYTKGVIVGDHESLSPIANNQISGGVIYNFPISKNNFSVNFDAAQTQVPMLNQNFELTTFSVGFGINF